MNKRILNLLFVFAVVLIVLFVPGQTSAQETPEISVPSKTLWVGSDGYTFLLNNFDKNNYDVYYSVANKDMATVNSKTGYVKALNVGETAQNTFYAILVHKNTGEVTVLSVPLYIKEKAASVRISNKEEAEIALLPGDTIDFNALMYNKAGQSTDKRCKYVTDYMLWYSSDSSVATVNKQTGVVTAKSSGSTTIFVKTFVYSNGSGNSTASDYVKIYVMDSKPTLTPTSKPSATATPTPKVTVTPTVKPTISPTPTITYAPTSDANIIAAKQISLSSVKITFDRDVSKTLLKSDLYLTSPNLFGKQSIKLVKFSDDGKSVEAYFWFNLNASSRYTVHYKDSSADFTSSNGVITSVVVESKNVENMVATPVEIRLFDKNGVDLTSATNSQNLSYECDNGIFDIAERTITLYSIGSTATLKVTYMSDSYDPLTGTYPSCSGSGTFLSLAKSPSYITDIKTNIGTSIDYSAPNKTIAVGDENVYVYTKAVYSDGTTKKTEKTEGDFTFKCSDYSKLLVSQTNGMMIPISPGNVDIYIYYKETMVSSYSIQIVEKRQPANLVLSKSSIRLTAGLYDDDAEIDIKFFDQYGKELTGSTYVHIEQVNNRSEYVFDLNGYMSDGKIKLNGSIFPYAGIYQYRVTYENLSQLFTINVSNPGTATTHKLDINETLIDSACYTAEDIARTIRIKLFSYDSKGNKVALINNSSSFQGLKFGYTLTKVGEIENDLAYPLPSNGIIEIPVVEYSGLNIDKLDVGSYRVRIYISESGYSKQTKITESGFTVVDTQKVPTIELIDTSLSYSSISNDSLIMQCFVVNGEEFTSDANQIYSLVDIEMQYADPILLVKSITLYEDVEGYSIKHVIELEGALINTY